jgi:transglutaminase-like putative cysteine protease
VNPPSHASGAAPEGGAPRPRLVADAALLAVSLAAGLGAARLTSAPGAAHVAGPVVATVATGHLAASAAARLRLRVAAVGLAGVVAVALAVIWGTVGATTWSGLPTAATWRALEAHFRAAGSVIRNNPTPLPPTSGVVLCLAAGAGLVAVLGRAVWAWQEPARPRSRPLVAVVPSFGLFCYTALLSSQVDRLTAALWYLASALVFVMVADLATTPALGRAPRAVAGHTPGRRPRRPPRGGAWRDLVPALVSAGLAIGLVTAASPAAGRLRLHALPFPAKRGQTGLGVAAGESGGGTGLGVFGAGSNDLGVRTIDLVDDLQGVLSSRTTEIMFTAQTPHPTYWQLAVLTRFDGVQWLPDEYTQAAALNDAVPTPRTVPGVPVLPDPTTAAHYTTTLTIAGLQSTLLPVPPTVDSVNGAAGANVVTGVGVVRQFEAQPGLTYDAVSRVPVSAPTSGASSSSDGVAPSLLALYLQMPAQPDNVVQLAHSIVAGTKGPAAKAGALARFFNSGRFHYSLSPPPLEGPNPLASFLFSTRTGFCQQFAAAFAVLARIDGLPTRVAVGFTTGTSSGHDRFRVTGADAHVWPEVYLGPQIGWASYEPTPAVTGEPSGLGVSTGTRAPTQKPSSAAGRTTPTSPLDQRRPTSTTAASTSTTVHVTTPARAGSAGRPMTTAPSTGVVVVLSLVLAALVVAGVAALVVRARRRRWVRGARVPGRGPPTWGAPRWWRVVTAPVTWVSTRRRRRRWRARGDTTGAVLAHWHAADKALERARLGKRPAETIDEHVARLRSLAGARWLAPHLPAPAPAPAGTAVGGDGGSGTGTVTGVEKAVTAYAGLAELASRASYGGRACTEDDVEDAERLEQTVRAGIGAGQRRVPAGV